MAEYTPTTEDVAYYYEGPDMDAGERRAEFDRWLAEHDRAVSEKAWDEGFAEDPTGSWDGDTAHPDAPKNPYRKKGDQL